MPWDSAETVFGRHRERLKGRRPIVTILRRWTKYPVSNTEASHRGPGANDDAGQVAPTDGRKGGKPEAKVG